MSDRAEKIGIVGAGSVGATIAYACMVRGVGKHISLFDRVRAKVEAEVLDLNHGLMFVPMAKLDGSDDITVLEHSDVIVVTAGAKQKPGQTRIDLAETNTAICRAADSRSATSCARCETAAGDQSGGCTHLRGVEVERAR